MTAHSTFPTYNEIAVADAAALLRRAGRILREATFWLDEGEMQCPALDDLAADASALAAHWAGRVVPPLDQPNVPDWIARVAVAWRAERDRSARR